MNILGLNKQPAYRHGFLLGEFSAHHNGDMGGHYFSHRGVAYDYSILGGLRFKVGPTQFVIVRMISPDPSQYRLETSSGIRAYFRKPAEIADPLARQAVELAFEADQAEGAKLAAMAAADRGATERAMPKR